jgi:hypothetical protein
LVISINDDIESTLSNLENNLRKTNKVTLEYEKDLLYSLITEKHRNQFIKRQNRINALKSPFIKARGVLQGILGENIEEIQVVEVLDLSGLEEENQRTKKIIYLLSHSECLEYFNDTNKYGLNRANKMWRKKQIQK